jgi:hypothetical protein
MPYLLPQLHETFSDNRSNLLARPFSILGQRCKLQTDQHNVSQSLGHA